MAGGERRPEVPHREVVHREEPPREVRRRGRALLARLGTGIALNRQLQSSSPTLRELIRLTATRTR